MKVPVTCPLCGANGEATVYHEPSDPSVGYRGGWCLDEYDMPCECDSHRLVDSFGYMEMIEEQARDRAPLEVERKAVR